jgi:hypothetical protein
MIAMIAYIIAVSTGVVISVIVLGRCYSRHHSYVPIDCRIKARRSRNPRR